MPKRVSVLKSVGISKALTGVKGLDDITYGGLPRNRPTLVAGGAGSGKTMFAMEFLVHGAMDFNEPGVFVSFEENIGELKKNFSSLGYDLDKLIKDKLLVIDNVVISAARSRRRANTTLRRCSSGWAMRSMQLVLNAWRWTRSRCCSPGCRIGRLFVPNCCGYSAG